jgi:hypothetical protein
MKVKRSQIEALADLILKEISTEIREIIREEFDIESKRLKRQLLESFGNTKISAKVPAQKQQIQNPVIKQKPKTVKSIDTGSDYINSIMEGIEVVPSTSTSEVFDDIDFNPTTSFQEATKQSINETRRMNSDNSVWRPEPGEAINFDPNTMDPTKIDWGEFVDEVDKRAKEKLL